VVRAVEVVKGRGAGAAPDARGLLVLVTDGRDTVGSTARGLATAAARELDGTWAVAIGEGADAGELQAVSGGGPVSSLSTWSHVSDAIRQRVIRYRADSATRFLLGYCSPRGEGEHSVTVEVQRADDLPIEVRMAPLRFDATGFTGGCDASRVANPCQWGQVEEHACGNVEGIPCGACGAIDRCLTCDDDGACVSP
jgi:hypothetical protein